MKEPIKNDRGIINNNIIFLLPSDNIASAEKCQSHIYRDFKAVDSAYHRKRKLKMNNVNNSKYHIPLKCTFQNIDRSLPIHSHCSVYL